MKKKYAKHLVIFAIILILEAVIYLHSFYQEEKRMNCARDLFEKVMIDEISVVRDDVASKQEAGQYFDRYIEFCSH